MASGLVRADVRARWASLVAALALDFALGGCSADKPLNPSFPLTVADARAAMVEMRQDPKVVERPIVLAMGWLDPGFAAMQFCTRLSAVLRQRTPEEPLFASASFTGCETFDACRKHLIDLVDQTWPSNDPTSTVEVDVIGISMGGLVARHAAATPDDGGKRLRIHRLFTISTPHGGAAMAGVPSFDARVIDMRIGSPFLRQLDQQLPAAEYQIIPYVRLGDMMVGETHAAPTGSSAWWVANMPLRAAHLAAATDPRILADILRRLRGEAPFTALPPAPLPGSEQATANASSDSAATAGL